MNITQEHKAVRHHRQPSSITHCKRCGTAFKVYACSARNGEGKYCSQACYDVQRKNPNTPEIQKQLAIKKARQWVAENPERAKANRKAYYLQDTKLAVKKTMAWRKANPDKARVQRRKYRARKRLRDPGYAIENNLRRRLNAVITGIGLKISEHSRELLGCDRAFLLQHLASKFLPGMTWANRGLYGWHVDHIKPIAYFDLTIPEHRKLCFHYSNLQPLWWLDNILKADKCP